MFRLSFILVVCVAAACATAQAELLEAVDLSVQNVASAAAYRDLQTPGRYYVAPLRLSIAQSGSAPAFGVQYLEDDEGAQKRTTAIFTLSVTLDAIPGELEQIKTALSEPGVQTAIAMLPAQYKLSYFVQTADKPLQKVRVAEGTLAAGATMALTFNVTAKKQEIRALLSGQNRAFGLLIELVPVPPFGTSRALSFSGDAFLERLQALRYLPATAQTDQSNALIDWLRAQTGTWGTGEAVAARAWLAALLGPAELTLDENNAPRFGWDLTRQSLEDNLKGKHPDLRSVATRSDKPRIAPILGFGNICAAYPNAIANLDLGPPGCDGLN